MEIIEPEKETQPDKNPPGPEKQRFLLTGLYLLAFGGILLADRMGDNIPNWYISWQTILIGVGIYIGEKHRFKNPTFLIPIGIGVLFLVNDMYPALGFRDYIGPVILIAIGFVLILRPRRIWNWRNHKHYNQYDQYMEDGTNPGIRSGEDYLDSVSIFGSTKKNIMSKQFMGGEATSVFGGTEINLLQADIHGEITLELTQVFGGCKLIIPAHWEIKSELVNIFGGTEDKRPTYNITPDHTKVVLLRGTSIFGGIEIRS